FDQRVEVLELRSKRVQQHERPAGSRAEITKLGPRSTSNVMKRLVQNAGAILNRAVGNVKVRPSMARPKGYDRDAALVAAPDLFWEQGYEATSISDLDQRTGLTRSSLYHEFGSKHELFEAALECYADRVIAQLLADLRNDDATLDTVAALFRRLA